MAMSEPNWEAIIWDAERRIGSFIAGNGDVNDRYVQKQIGIIIGAYNAMEVEFRANENSYPSD